MFQIFKSFNDDFCLKTEFPCDIELVFEATVVDLDKSCDKSISIPHTRTHTDTGTHIHMYN